MGCNTDLQTNCSSSCCGGQRKEFNSGDIPHQLDNAGSRCSTPEPEEPQEPQEPQEDPNNPSCCKDKPSPCCDVSCLDRIALRECDKGPAPCPGDASSKFLRSAGCHGSNGNPCGQHRRSARAKYATTLEALGCICRALIALGQESCCAPPKAASLSSKRRSTESSRSILRTSLDSCCEKGSTSSVKCRSTRPKEKGKPCSSGCCGTSKSPAASTPCAPEKVKFVNSSGCCSKPQTIEAVEQHASATNDVCTKASTSSKECCGESKVSSPSTVEGCCSPRGNNPGGSGSSSGCCSKPWLSECAGLEINQGRPEPCNTGCCSKPVRPIGSSERTLTRHDACSDGCCSTPGLTACSAIEEKTSVATIINPATPDPEKGVTGKEHVVLSISGMTCTGCETKIKRTLGTLPSVQNLKTSLVLSRAEFDLHVGIQSFDEVLKHLQRTTEFKFEKVTDKGSHVDIIVPNASQFMQQDWPHGVTEMVLIDEETVNVAFDAKIVGARDLLNHGWGRPINLAPPRPDPTLMAGNKHVRQMGYMTILSIILTIPVLVLAWAPVPERKVACGSASLALATIVQVVIAGPFYPKALKALFFSRIIEMDLLIVLSTSAAYTFSVVAFGFLVAGQPLATSGGGFFETSTLLVTLIMVGRYVAALARQKAVESISLRSLQTPTAIIVDESGLNEEIDVRLLQYGDTFKVLPDSKIPTDGTVISGLSEVNESMLTGESIPVDKSFGSTVIAGTVNASGTLIIKLTQLPADNTISSIAGMVDQAKLSKPKIQDLADRVASYFVPVVIALTIITFVIWVAVGTAVRNQSGSRATTEAILYAITVLIVSCPCAIGLAVPMVIVIASGVAAERGIIFKAADSIEVAYKASHIMFDKTGTLTEGKLTVGVEHIDSTGDSTALSLLLGLIGSNKHPISAAVTAHLKAKDITPSTVTDTKVLTGKGVEGFLPGTQTAIRAGNSRWLNLSSNPQVKSVLDQGYTAFCFTINDVLVAVFGLEDSLRPDALETVTQLQTRGITVHLLSGDDDGAVQSIARQVGITTQNVRSRCTPADKQDYIRALLTAPEQSSSSHRGKTPTTVFIGDGTNDAVALATATIGVHMSQETGSDIAKSAADVVLMRPSLLSVLTMINFSEKAVRRIKFNFGWSFIYNLCAVLLGAGAFVNARIPPEFAGLGELVSVLPVVVAAVLLRWARV